MPTVEGWSQKGLPGLTCVGGRRRVLRTNGRQPCLHPHTPGVHQACSCLRTFAHAVSAVRNVLPSNLCIANSFYFFMFLLRCPFLREALPDSPPLCPHHLSLSTTLHYFLCDALSPCEVILFTQLFMCSWPVFSHYNVSTTRVGTAELTAASLCA